MDQNILNALMESMLDMEEVKPYGKLMIYGESGVGKTVAAQQLAQAITPDNKMIAYFDAVEGWASLHNHPELKRRTKLFRYEGISQLEFFIDAVNEGVEPFNHFGTIVCDEYSTMAKKDLTIVQKTQMKRVEGKAEDVITQTDRGINTTRMTRTTDKLLSNPINVIFVAHVRYDKNERTGIVTTSPDFMPATSKSIRENLHLVGHMTRDERMAEDGETVIYDRKIQVHPTRTIVCKTRVGGLDTTVPIDDLLVSVPRWIHGEWESNAVDEIKPEAFEVSSSDESDDEPIVVE